MGRAVESGEWVLHDTEVGMCSVTTALLEVRMQRGGGGGPQWKLLGAPHTGGPWHWYCWGWAPAACYGTVSQCPFSDFPACLLQCALKAKLAVEASLLSPKRQLEETSSKRFQAVALVHGLLVACRGTQVTSELCSGSQPLSLPLGCCLWQENRCPLGAGRFHRCAEPVPLWAQHGLLKRSRACTDAALERICSRAQTAELISWQR